MKAMDFEVFCNFATTLGNMMRAELEQERKHFRNPRCKAPNWEGIAAFAEYATNERPTAQQVYDMAHGFNWG